MSAAATPQRRTRRVIALGTVQTRRAPRPCAPGHHAGSFIRDERQGDWLGLAWWTCTRCGSTVVLEAGAKPEAAA